MARFVFGSSTSMCVPASRLVQRSTRRNSNHIESTGKKTKETTTEKSLHRIDATTVLHWIQAFKSIDSYECNARTRRNDDEDRTTLLGTWLWSMKHNHATHTHTKIRTDIGEWKKKKKIYLYRTSRSSCYSDSGLHCCDRNVYKRMLYTHF